MGSDSPDERKPLSRWLDRPIEDINAEFYRQRPHSYLTHRLWSVAVMAGRPDLVTQALAEGLTIGGKDVTWSGLQLDAEEQQSFATSELQILTYHTAESLLRLVLAHARPDLPSPAFNVAGLGYQGDLYQQAKRLIVDASDDQLDRLITVAIHGFEAIPDGAFGGEGPTDEMVVAGRENLRHVLRHTAEHVGDPDYQAIYKAAKHGLAVRTGNAGLRISGPTPDDQPLLDQTGEALVCLSVPRRGERGVEEVTVWSNPAFAIAYIHMALEVMEQIWQLGRYRFDQANFDPDELVIRLFDSPSLAELQRVTRDAGPSHGEGHPAVLLPKMRVPTGWVLDDD